MYKAKTLLLLFALLLILGMQVECRRKLDISDPAVAKMILGKCAERMQIKFPPSTRLLNYALCGGQDNTTLLKIEIEEKDLQSFIDNSPFAGKEFRTDRRYTSPTGQKWWTAHESATKYRSTFTTLLSRGYGEPITILIELDKPEKAIIYLEYMGPPIL